MEVAEAGARMPKMAIRRFLITTPPQSGIALHIENACEEIAAYLAGRSSSHQAIQPNAAR
jgi:hypothetical protein